MINIHQIVYSDETHAKYDPGFKLLDNRRNPRPDWYEYFPIRNFLLENPLNEDNFYGFFSPRFSEKIFIDAHRVIRFIESLPHDTDVAIFSPQPDMGAFFLNVFEQNEAFDPGFIEISQEFFDHIQFPVDINSLIMDSRTIVYSNYFVAKPGFWRQWFALAEKLFQLCEAGTTDLSRKLLAPTAYKGGVQRKIFLLERIAPLLLTIQPEWKAIAYNTFECGWSSSRLSEFPDLAILSDAVKIAYKEQGYPQFLTMFGKLREQFRAGNAKTASGTPAD